MNFHFSSEQLAQWRADAARLHTSMSAMSKEDRDKVNAVAGALFDMDDTLFMAFLMWQAGVDRGQQEALA